MTMASLCSSAFSRRWSTAPPTISSASAQIVDDTSREDFHPSAAAGTAKGPISRSCRKDRRGGRLHLQDAREPGAASAGMAPIMTAVMDTMKAGARDAGITASRLKTLQRDIISLTDHARFQSGKISFLLDAVLGPDLHRAERHHQDLLDRRGGVPAADPGREHLRNEFRHHARAQMDVGLSLRDLAHDPFGGLALCSISSARAGSEASWPSVDDSP